MIDATRAPDHLRTLSEHWEEFRLSAIPDVSDVQRREMEKSYYVGATTVLRICASMGDADIEDEAGAEVLERLVAECGKFGADLRGLKG